MPKIVPELTARLKKQPAQEKNTEEGPRGALQKKSVPKIFLFSSKNACVVVSFLKSLLTVYYKLYYKETATQVFSCKQCEIFKNTYFEGYLRTTASVRNGQLKNSPS